MHQKVFGSWALPEPAGGAYSAPPDSLAGFRELEGDWGWEGKWREMERRGERAEGKREKKGEAAIAISCHSNQLP